MPGFIAVSVQKLNSSDEFFKYVLDACEKSHYEGPITFVPLNEISKSFLVGKGYSVWNPLNKYFIIYSF